MTKVINWIKTNKLSSVLIALLILVVISSKGDYQIQTNLGGRNLGYKEEIALERSMVVDSAIPPIGGPTPQLDINNRLVITTSNLSLLVKDVSGTIDNIKSKAIELGGYMVSTSLTKPEGVTNGTIVIRVPSEKLDEALLALRGFAVKVVSENISGTDITDQYIDVEERLATLEKTKAKYNQILDSATEVEDILTVTERIIYVQNQIDYYKGQLQYMEKTSQSSLISVYLSTDELELPYTPDQPWKPKLIFKI